MKSVVILAAVAAMASAACAPAYKTLANPGTGKCVVLDEYDSDTDTWTLTIGTCSLQSDHSLVLTYDPKAHQLKDVNGYCVASLDNDKEDGSAVALIPCDDVKGDKGASWTFLDSTEQWKDGFGLCLDYDSDSESMVHSKCQCAPLPIGSMQQWDFVGAPVPPPLPPTPPPPPPPATQCCSSWSTKWGGPVNSCGSGYKYTASASTTCAADGSNCRAICCTPAPPMPGSDPCTQGPSMWCASTFNANQCGVSVSECQKYCNDLAEYPELEGSDVCASSTPMPGSDPCTQGPSMWCASTANANQCGVSVSDCQTYCNNLAEYPELQGSDVCSSHVVY